MNDNQSIPGGRFEVNGRLVDANGNPLGDSGSESEIVVSANGLQEITNQKQQEAANPNASGDEFGAKEIPLDKMNVPELRALPEAEGLALDLRKAELVEAIQAIRDKRAAQENA